MSFSVLVYMGLSKRFMVFDLEIFQLLEIQEILEKPQGYERNAARCFQAIEEHNGILPRGNHSQCT